MLRKKRVSFASLGKPDEQVRDLIREAGLESARTCQACWSDGTLHILPGNVAATLCEADAERLSKPVRR